MTATAILIEVLSFQLNAKNNDCSDCKLEEESSRFWNQHCLDLLEYSEESWRSEGTCCHLTQNWYEMQENYKNYELTVIPIVVGDSDT